MNPRSINYQIQLEKFMAKLGETRPHLVLHSCCAPCSTTCLATLSPHFDLTVLYYNPNIAPEEEYARRAEEQRRLIADMPLPGRVEFVQAEYDPVAFYAAARGLESEPEGGARCRACFELRLRHAAREARARHADYFSTTLTVGTRKDAYVINPIGQRIGQEEGVPFLCADFKKRGGFDRSTALSEQYQLYRQDYCGCVFSRREREQRKL